MAKHFVAKERRHPWKFDENKQVMKDARGRWMVDEEITTWEDCGNRHTNLALYGSERKAITTNWSVGQDETRVKVFLLDTDELEPVNDDQARLEWADRMIQRCGAIVDELTKKLKGDV